MFLDSACVGLAPRCATEAVQKFNEMALWCPEKSATLHHIAMDDMRAAARPVIAGFIHAREDEIALLESTTHGLNIASEIIPFTGGDRVLMSDLEFLEVAMPWAQRGYAVDLVKNRDGKALVEDFADAITTQTKVIAISSVQWSNGFLCDLAGLSRLCTERGLWLVVDAIQQLGAIPLDVGKTPIDMVVCGGHKWLTSPFGCGFMYVSQRARAELLPATAGYHPSLTTPEGGWGDYFQTPSISPRREYEFVDEARRYEIGGTANYPGAIGLAALIGMLRAAGAGAIAEHIYGLTDYLISALQSLRAQVVTAVERQHRSGIVTFSVGGAAQNVALMNHLLDNEVLVSVRYTSQVGGVRVSCHYFNSRQDLDTLLNHTERFLKQLHRA